MNDSESRRHQMFTRVCSFGEAHASDFSPTSLGTQLFTSLNNIVNQLDGHAASKESSRGTARQGTATRAEARAALREDLEAIRRTARAMAHEVPGLDDKFRMPGGESDLALLNAARAFAADAAPFAAQFIAHELPADFLTDLNDDIAAMEIAMETQSSGIGNAAGARAAIEASIEEGLTVKGQLDAIVKNKYGNNAAVLAEWASASHTERAPRRRSTVTPSTPPPAAPGGRGPTG